MVADRTVGENSRNLDPYWGADNLARNIEDLKKELPRFPASTQFLAWALSNEVQKFGTVQQVQGTGAKLRHI